MASLKKATKSYS